MAEDFNITDDIDVSTGSISVTNRYRYDDLPVDFNGVLFGIFLYDRYKTDDKRNTHIKNQAENKWLRVPNILKYPPIPLDIYMGKVLQEYESGDNGGFDDPYDGRQNRNFNGNPDDTKISVELVGEKYMVSYPDDSTRYKEFSLIVPVKRHDMFRSWNEFINNVDPREYAPIQARSCHDTDPVVGSEYLHSSDIVFPHSGHYFGNRQGMEICRVDTDKNKDYLEPIVANYERLVLRAKKISADYRRFEDDVRTGRFFKDIRCAVTGASM